MKKVVLLYSLLFIAINTSGQTFVLDTTTTFDDIKEGDAAFADIDGDSDLDVLIIGNSSSTVVAKLYKNDGFGTFSLVPGTSIQPTHFGSISFADVDNDNDQDVLVTGQNNITGVPSTILYLNDSTGNFTMVTGTPFTDVTRGTTEFGDVDNDGDLDVMLTGENNFGSRISKLYLNDGVGNYTQATGSAFHGVRSSSIAFADVDNDNDLDVLIAGMKSTNAASTRLYLNDSLGGFTYNGLPPFIDVTSGTVSFSDIDNDGDQDVLITGSNTSQHAKLYTNDGTGVFTEVLGTPFDGVQYSSVQFADVDNDGDEDVLIMGEANNGSFVRISKLYVNDGLGNFSLVTGAGVPFDGAYKGAVNFAHVDNDNKIDLLLIGENHLVQRITKLYRNMTLTTGIRNEDIEKNNVFVFPNPFSESTSIQFDDDIPDDFEFIVCDVLGEEIIRIGNINGNQIKLNKNMLGTGLFLTYLVNHKTKEKVFIEKLIIQ